MPSHAVPPPPPGTPAQTFALPGREAELVTGPTPGAEARTERRVEASQEQALKRLQKRLQAIYARQADLYAQEQTRLLGDPEQKQLQVILPKLKAAFDAYAVQRTPLFIQLINLAGFPDPNPKGQPPPAGLSPLAKRIWEQANKARTDLAALDAAYSRTAEGLVAEVARLAGQDRLALLHKIEAFRQQMNERAIAEAVNPLQANSTSVVLSIPGRPAVVLPAVPPRTVTLPAVPPAPPLPKVDSQEARLGPAERRKLIERQLSIWLALNNKVLASGPGSRVPDQTQDFQEWRIRQQAGP